MHCAVWRRYPRAQKHDNQEPPTTGTPACLLGRRYIPDSPLLSFPAILPFLLELSAPTLRANLENYHGLMKHLLFAYFH